MEILNLGGAEDSYSPAPKSRKKLRVILGIGALAAVTGLGSTLAANISLNGGGNVEFGQGVATTAACDDTITLTPVSTFVNSAYAGESTFGSLQFRSQILISLLKVGMFPLALGTHVSMMTVAHGTMDMNNMRVSTSMQTMSGLTPAKVKS